MVQLNKYIILISSILEINGSTIKFNEIYNYINCISKKLNEIGYAFDEVDDLDIIYFCKSYDTFFTYNKGNIISVKLTKEKQNELKERYINNLSEELKAALKYDKKYLLPLNIEENITLYLVEFKNKELMEKVKTTHVLRFNMSCEYILNLKNINSNYTKEEKIKYLTELFNDCVFEERISYKIEDLEKIIDSLYLCIQPKFEQFNRSISDFNFLEGDLEMAYTELYEIYLSSISNKCLLNKIGVNIKEHTKEEGKQKVYK